MEMKEFYYQDGIRVSLFNLDHKSIPFHKHDEVSDIMYCAKGSVNIELPDLEQKINVQKGDYFQIPVGTRHRFTNGEPQGVGSRYILMQLGDFNIDFERDHAALEKSLQHVATQMKARSRVYIKDRQQDIASLSAFFSANKPDELTEEEVSDVVRALTTFANIGIEGAYPSNDVLVEPV